MGKIGIRSAIAKSQINEIMIIIIVKIIIIDRVNDNDNSNNL